MTNAEVIYTVAVLLLPGQQALDFRTLAGMEDSEDFRVASERSYVEFVHAASQYAIDACDAERVYDLSGANMARLHRRAIGGDGKAIRDFRRAIPEVAAYRAVADLVNSTPAGQRGGTEAMERYMQTASAARAAAIRLVEVLTDRG